MFAAREERMDLRDPIAIFLWVRGRTLKLSVTITMFEVVFPILWVVQLQVLVRVTAEAALTRG